MSDTSKVKQLRETKKLRLVDLRHKTGLGLTTLGLADEGILSTRTAALLAAALGVRPEDLMPEARKRNA